MAPELTGSKLGYGTSALLGPNSREYALSLLETAFDNGITHFDTARAYGSGDAEGVVGEFLAGKRDQVTVTTKLGTAPPAGLARQKLLRSAVRRVMRLSPRLREALGRQGARMVQRHNFSPEEARTSLETSLRELRVDHIDVLLLHGGRPEDCTPELFAYLDGARREGKIGRIGVGTDVESAVTILRDAPQFAEVVQFEHSVLAPGVSRIPADSGATVITHGSLAGLGELRGYLNANPDEAKRWSDAVGADCTDPKALAALMLLYAVQTGGRGPVLFASTKLDNIRSNAEAVRNEAYTAEQVSRFAELAGTSGVKQPT
jgi:aryl-alcohol dehydrogenase-like predicted oxidoreductase